MHTKKLCLHVSFVYAGYSCMCTASSLFLDEGYDGAPRPLMFSLFGQFRPVSWNCSFESRANHHGNVATNKMITEQCAELVHFTTTSFVGLSIVS